MKNPRLTLSFNAVVNIMVRHEDFNRDDAWACALVSLMQEEDF